jgi:hypothetical protein
MWKSNSEGLDTKIIYLNQYDIDAEGLLDGLP